MNVPIRAAEFCILTWPPEDRLAAFVSGYFDDSQSTGDIWVVGGYVGYLNQWEHFERLWGEALDKHEVPYFHMREMADPSKPFAKWLPAENHQSEIIAYFKDLTAAIKRCHLRMFVSAAWIEDIKRFNDECGLHLEPFPLAAYTCMAKVGATYSNLPATMTFDNVEKVDSKLKTARTYADSDRHVAPGVCDRIVTSHLPMGVTSRDVRPMQAADMIAWEARKAFFNMKPWQLLPDRQINDDRQSMWQNYLKWIEETTGEDLVVRKSLDALMENRADCIVWDYQQLCDANRARRGIWTLGDDE